jgi:uncharacterized membrane protein YeaQ/YmgE (transglycosylase-associated protein family)
LSLGRRRSETPWIGCGAANPTHGRILRNNSTFIVLFYYNVSVAENGTNPISEAVMLAEQTLAAGGVLSWIGVGLLTGWLAEVFMKGGGYGALADLLMGLAGGLLGGFLYFVSVSGDAGVASMVTAFLGACILIIALRGVASRLAAS